MNNEYNLIDSFIFSEKDEIFSNEKGIYIFFLKKNLVFISQNFVSVSINKNNSFKLSNLKFQTRTFFKLQRKFGLLSKILYSKEKSKEVNIGVYFLNDQYFEFSYSLNRGNEFFLVKITRSIEKSITNTFSYDNTIISGNSWGHSFSIYLKKIYPYLYFYEIRILKNIKNYKLQYYNFFLLFLNTTKKLVYFFINSKKNLFYNDKNVLNYYLETNNSYFNYYDEVLKKNILSLIYSNGTTLFLINIKLNNDQRNYIINLSKISNLKFRLITNVKFIKNSYTTVIIIFFKDSRFMICNKILIATNHFRLKNSNLRYILRYKANFFIGIFNKVLSKKKNNKDLMKKCFLRIFYFSIKYFRFDYFLNDLLFKNDKFSNSILYDYISYINQTENNKHNLYLFDLIIIQIIGILLKLSKSIKFGIFGKLNIFDTSNYFHYFIIKIKILLFFIKSNSRFMRLTEIYQDLDDIDRNLFILNCKFCSRFWISINFNKKTCPFSHRCLNSNNKQIKKFDYFYIKNEVINSENNCFLFSNIIRKFVFINKNILSYVF
ncbi:hypothetical protein [Guillardia theta]|uniref:Uncharacterized protein n=1 Tax=Guillardia theta TaxID=55529 RepID=Q9XG37_GUITH|nr:hypothetical protein GTHECHR2132 [Guillardia theta]CAB40403.1 hypothetical protein [Guillardia theta]